MKKKSANNVKLYELFGKESIGMDVAAIRLRNGDIELALSAVYLLRQIIREGVYVHNRMELVFEGKTRLSMVGWDDIAALSQLWMAKPYEDDFDMVDELMAREKEIRQQNMEGIK